MQDTKSLLVRIDGRPGRLDRDFSIRITDIELAQIRIQGIVTTGQCDDIVTVGPPQLGRWLLLYL